QIPADPVARLLIRERSGEVLAARRGAVHGTDGVVRARHDSSLTVRRSSRRSFGLRATRISSNGPQTGRKSHQRQAPLSGAAGRNPWASARETASTTVRAPRRASSFSTTTRSVYPPSAVQ